MNHARFKGNSQPLSHWIALALERVEKLAADSVVRDCTSEAFNKALWAEREALIDAYMAASAAETERQREIAARTAND